MKRFSRRALSLAAFLSATTAMTGIAAAQSGIAPPAVFQSIDSRGVDLTKGTFRVATPGIAVGRLDLGGLSYARVYDSAVSAWRDTLEGVINSSSPGSYPGG